MKHPPRHAIVDIGSNSIRLVVFGGPDRAPIPLFNEKIMAGLGRGVGSGGRLDPDSVAMALKGLERFAALVALMKPAKLRVVATAAVREAADGEAFLTRVRALGLPAELLSGEGEARASGYGVIAAHPGARGMVADMGGGSLELVRIADARVHELASLRFGAMRVAEIRLGGRGRLRKALRTALAPLDWLGTVRGQPLYLVGGAWRALARVHMQHSGWPLPVLADYSFSPADARELKLKVRAMGSAELAAVPGVKPARALQLDDAAALLAALVAEADPSEVVISAQGLREGLLYEALDDKSRLGDPLIAGLQHALAGQQLADGHAERLLAWSDPAFPDELPADRRLRLASYMIAGTSWASNPDFRAVAGEDLALHGNWIGIDAAGRAVMAQTLHIGLGGDPAIMPELLAQLAPRNRLDRASAWGHALRLAQRLGGNAAAALDRTPLALADDGALELRLPRGLGALADGALERRLARLGQALGRPTRVQSKLST